MMNKRDGFGWFCRVVSCLGNLIISPSSLNPTCNCSHLPLFVQVVAEGSSILGVSRLLGTRVGLFWPEIVWATKFWAIRITSS